MKVIDLRQCDSEVTATKCDTGDGGMVELQCSDGWPAIERLELFGQGLLVEFRCRPQQLPAVSVVKIVSRTTLQCDDFLGFTGVTVFLRDEMCQVRQMEKVFVLKRWNSSHCSYEQSELFQHCFRISLDRASVIQLFFNLGLKLKQADWLILRVFSVSPCK
ncbi:MAG: hypothetical protein ABW185_25095 [Sedimenticola sp.]